MNRPEHDDFWLLAKLIIDQDKSAEASGDVIDIIGRIVDPESIRYMAAQRALRAAPEGAVKGPELEHTMMVLMAVWLDAFVLGAAYQAAKDREG